LKGSFEFLEKIEPGKNRENFRVFQVKTKVVKGNIAQKNRENFMILQSHNKLSSRYLHKLPLFTVDNGQDAALRLAVFQGFRQSV
jgi:hypothetical protein